MPSKMVTNRQKAAADLSGSVEVYAEQAAGVFLDLLQPFLAEGETPPDLVHLQRLLGRRLDLLRKRLVEVDEVLRSERKEDSRLRLQRDAAAEELKALVIRLRVIIDQLCGAETCARLLDVGGRISPDPVVLYRVASRMVEGLRQGLLDGDLPLLAGVALDTSAWIALLEEPMARLDEALAGLTREKPETGNRLVEKSAALEEYDRAYRTTASLVEGFFRYVGRSDLAARIRPKQRSPAAPGDPTDTDPPRLPPDDGDAAPAAFEVPVSPI
jgi:hypothetical protein